MAKAECWTTFQSPEASVLLTLLYCSRARAESCLERQCLSLEWALLELLSQWYLREQHRRSWLKTYWIRLGWVWSMSSARVLPWIRKIDSRLHYWCLVAQIPLDIYRLGKWRRSWFCGIVLSVTPYTLPMWNVLSGSACSSNPSESSSAAGSKACALLSKISSSSAMAFR